MNPSLRLLTTIAQKKSRIILGLMSGTSMDGLDMALCEVTDHGLETKVRVIHNDTVPYDSKTRSMLHKLCFNKQADMEDLTRFNRDFGAYTADQILHKLNQWGFNENKPDLIASHGQTVFHLPSGISEKSAATLQLGDGDMIAQQTGIITISDFRQKNIAGGGSGAPLAVYGDYILFLSTENHRILLNIGGISNLTFIPQAAPFSQVICSDVGPGNALSDAWIHHIDFSKYFDKNGRMAGNGKINEDLLTYWLDDDFFKKPFPKTTGKEYFNLNFIKSAIDKLNVHDISNEDILATISALTVRSITNQIDNLLTGITNTELIISGGGIHHPLIMKGLAEHFGSEKLFTTDKFGINPDAKEAVLFALLANECISGDALHFSGNKHYPGVSMGKISLPH